MHYAGIGSRTVPEGVLAFISGLGRIFAFSGMTLRSGHAPGADMAFEEGHGQAGGAMEIYLPWKRFNGSSSPLFGLPNLAGAGAIAREHHPGWAKMSNGARMCIARNVYQVLGKDLASGADFAVGWSRGSGGTEFTFRLAASYSIPVVRLERIAPLHDLPGGERLQIDPEWTAGLEKEGKRIFSPEAGSKDTELKVRIQDFVAEAARIFVDRVSEKQIVGTEAYVCRQEL